MVDGLVYRSDGSIAALEITTIADEASMQSEAMLARAGNQWDIDGLAWVWSVHLAGTVQHRQLKPQLAELLHLLESQNIWHSHDPRLWYPPVFDEFSDDVRRWITTNQLEVVGHPTLPNQGHVWVLPLGFGGAVPGIDVVPGWLSDELKTDTLQENIDKLVDSGQTETHLFLWVLNHGMPTEVFLGLTSNSDVPTTPLVMPDGLSWVWVGHSTTSPALVYSQEHNWLRGAITPPTS